MMIIILWLSFVACGFSQPVQINNIQEIRRLYYSAPLLKEDARTLDKLMQAVDSNAAPLMYCYKGANEMIQAKYVLNPVVKLQDFNRGKRWITTAVGRDTMDLEMRFIRFSIQSNLPAFLGYREDIPVDKKFLLAHLDACRDTDLKKMITNYLSSSALLTKEELKQLNN